MWFTDKNNFYNPAVEKDGGSIFTITTVKTIWKPACFIEAV
jgi:hypothetical protein